MAKVFREKSLERISSPEQLDDYIHVSNPSVWMILGVIVLLLVSGIIWAGAGAIRETAPAALVVGGGQATAYVAQERASEVAQGDAVEAGGASGTVTLLMEQPVATSEAVALAGEAASSALGQTAWAMGVQVSIDLPDGVYEASVITSSYHPIALLFGSGE